MSGSTRSVIVRKGRLRASSSAEIHPEDAQATTLKVSIIVPTVNRPVEIANLLVSILASTVLPHEIIIVDQSQADYRSGVVASYPPLGPRLVYIHDTTIRGASAARNVGIELAEGDAILFLDDDVILEPGFLAEIVRTLCDRPECAGVSGVITNYERSPLLYRLRTWLLYWGPFVDDRQKYYENAGALRGQGPFRITRAGSGLFAVRSALLTSIRFRILFGDYELGEDVDFSFALARHGQLLLTPDAGLVHLRVPGGRNARPYCIQELESWSAIFRRHLAGRPANRLAFLILTAGLVLEGIWHIVSRKDAQWIPALRSAAKNAVRSLTAPL
jgi:GT2 family glycosyltransferase